MILVFIILATIILLILVTFILMLSNLKLDIKELHISNIKGTLKVDFVLNIETYFLNKIKIMKYTIDNHKVSNLLKLSKLALNKFKVNNVINRDIKTILKNVDFTIEYFKLEGEFSTFDIVLSAWIYGITNAVIPMIIARKLEGRYINNIDFLKINKNKLNINLSCIINVKMVNIINILQYLKKKGRENNGKSSYRRSYAYSNE